MPKEAKTSRIQLKRVYDPPARSDGQRILVERLWPRGVKKSDLPLDAWIKEIAPSDELRRWFSHDPQKWDEFRRRYFVELDTQKELWNTLLERATNQPITLLFSSRDTAHNNAVALREYLLKQKNR